MHVASGALLCSSPDAPYTMHCRVQQLAVLRAITPSMLSPARLAFGLRPLDAVCVFCCLRYITTVDVQPGRTSYNFTSTSFGYDSVTIAPGEPGYCSSCIVHIAVYGFTTSQFSITYTTNNSDGKCGFSTQPATHTPPPHVGSLELTWHG